MQSQIRHHSTQETRAMFQMGPSFLQSMDTVMGSRGVVLRVPTSVGKMCPCVAACGLPHTKV